MSLYQQHIQTLQHQFENAIQTHNLDGILIYSGQQSYAFRDDNALPFKTNPYFKYWLPLVRQQKSFIFIKPNQKPHVFLFQEQDYWHAQQQVPEGEWQQHFDLSVTDEPNFILRLLDAHKHNIAVIADAANANNLFGEWPQNQINPLALLNELDYHRAYKTPYEIENMRVANQLAAKAHTVAKNAFFSGCTEQQIHNAYLDSLQIRESQLPYNNIIAFNQNASVLHYDDYQINNPSVRRSFLIDAGAEYKGYNADISRTYIDETAPDAAEFKSLYDAYSTEYFSLLDEIKIGKPYLELHDSAHRRLSKLLSEFELVNCSADETYDKGYSQLVFPCGVGHYIGAQVHDVGGYLANPQGITLNKDSRYPFLRLMRPIEENIVFTVEPGIYLIDQLLNPQKDNPDFNWKRINQLKPFGGFRLEDSIAVTKNGIENLSVDAFEKLES